MIVRPVISGSSIRVKVENVNGVGPVSFSSAYIGRLQAGAAIVDGTNTRLTFNARSGPGMCRNWRNKDVSSDRPPPMNRVHRSWLYQPNPGYYDEMQVPDGALRPHWKGIIEALEFGEAGFALRWQEGRPGSFVQTLHSDRPRSLQNPGGFVGPFEDRIIAVEGIMSRCLGSAAVALVFLASGMFAQSRATRLGFSEFEVASIKPTPPNTMGRWIRMRSSHEFAAQSHTLKTLAAAAYNLNPRAISGGPAWVDADHYDIVAKAPGEVRPTLDEQMSMLRKLLADRFQFTFHREPRELQVYELTIAKGGAKIKESTVSPDASPEGPPPLIFVVSPQLVRLPARNATMADFASVLQRAALDYPVVDKTGLPARYDFDLEFTPDETVFGGVLGKGSDDSDKPGLLAAVSQQLGLKLEARKGTVQAMVIDGAKRPSEN